MNNVFKCPCCFSSYTKDQNLPISLDCGDVFCLSCIQSLTSSTKVITCPIDGKRIQINLNSLTTCKAILDHLPSKPKSKDQFYCKHHPLKKIKYSCETDNTAFCSLCFVNHKKHQINSFHPSSNYYFIYFTLGLIMSEQMQSMLKATENKNKALGHDVDVFSNKKCQLTSRLKEQIDYIKQSTEKIINEIVRQSNEYQAVLKEKYKRKLDKIEQYLLENKKYKQFVSSIENDIHMYLSALKTNSSLIYDDIYETKRTIVKKWEDFLLTYNMTKIDINKQNLFDEDEVVIDYKSVCNGLNVFKSQSLSSSSLKQNNDNKDKDKKDMSDANKENINTPKKTRKVDQVYQMSANSTNFNTYTNTNNYSLNNQSQRNHNNNSNILKEKRISLTNQKKSISNINSL